VKIKGILSIESIIAFSILVLLIASLPLQKSFSARDIFAEQKKQDLEIVWGIEETSSNEMQKDAELFIGENKFEIKFENKVRVLINQ